MTTAEEALYNIMQATLASGLIPPGSVASLTEPDPLGLPMMGFEQVQQLVKQQLTTSLEMAAIMEKFIVWLGGPAGHYSFPKVPIHMFIEMVKGLMAVPDYYPDKPIWLTPNGPPYWHRINEVQWAVSVSKHSTISLTQAYQATHPAHPQMRTVVLPFEMVGQLMTILRKLCLKLDIPDAATQRADPNSAVVRIEKEMERVFKRLNRRKK